MAHRHSHTPPHIGYRVAKPVSRTERGAEALELLFRQLQEEDGIPSVAPAPGDPEGTNSNVTSLNNLGQRMEHSTLDQAVRELQKHDYFRADLGHSPVMVVQIRNRVPSDASVVWRNQMGEFPISRMLGVSLNDPIGPLVVSPRLKPAKKPRRTGDLQRRVFALHEMVKPNLLERSDVFRSIYQSTRSSWLGIVVSRNREFTWVLYIWYKLRELGDVRRLRAGLELVAEELATCARQNIADGFSDAGRSLVDTNSLQVGRLVLTSDFEAVRLQNHTAENMMRQLKDACGAVLDRGFFYEKLRTQYNRRRERGAPTRWAIDHLGCPVPDGGQGAVGVHAEAMDGELVIHFRELKPFALEQMKLLDLPPIAVHPPSGVVTQVRKSRQAFYVPQLECIVRPVWESDLIAHRIYRDEPVRATQFMKSLTKDFFRNRPALPISFRKRIVAVAHGL